MRFDFLLDPTVDDPRRVCGDEVKLSIGLPPAAERDVIEVSECEACPYVIGSPPKVERRDPDTGRRPD